MILHGRVRDFDELYRIAFLTGFAVQDVPGLGRQMMRCHSLMIDSGHRTDEVYEFGRRPGVAVAKGMQSGTYRTKPSKIEWFPERGMQALAQEIQLVNTNYFKTKIVRLMNLPAGSQGEWMLPRDTGEDYLAECTAEHQVREKIGGKRNPRWDYIWKKKSEGAANESFDCEVYLTALADILRVPLMRDDSPVVGMMSVPVAGGVVGAKPKAAARTVAVKAGGVPPRGFLG